MESEVLDIGNRSLRDRPTLQYSSGKNQFVKGVESLGTRRDPPGNER